MRETFTRFPLFPLRASWFLRSYQRFREPLWRFPEHLLLKPGRNGDASKVRRIDKVQRETSMGEGGQAPRYKTIRDSGTRYPSAKAHTYESCLHVSTRHFDPSLITVSRFSMNFVFPRRRAFPRSTDSVSNLFSRVPEKIQVGACKLKRFCLTAQTARILGSFRSVSL